MGWFDNETPEQKKQKEDAKKKEAEEKIRKSIEEAENKNEIPHFENKLNSIRFMKSNNLKKTAGGTITGLSIMGAGFNTGASVKANELALSLANNELLEILINQNEEIIKLLKAKKK